MINRRHFAALAGALSVASLSGPARSRPSLQREPTLLHIAWMTFKPGVTAERIEQHFAACRALPSKIPLLRSLVCGANVTQRANGMTHGIVVTLRDLDAIDQYLKHPEHIKVVTPMKDDVDQLLVMDLQL